MRQKHLDLRRQLAPSERLIKDSVIAQKLGRFLVHAAPQHPHPLKLGIYIPFFDETDPFLEVFQILEENRVSYQPYVPLFKRRPRALSFVHPISRTAFKDFFRASHRTDVWVTPSALWSAEGANDIRFWIVPGVCFTSEGHRIGYGTGFYDTFLAGQKRGFFIGIAYDVQINPIPFEPQSTDIPMHMVITEHHSYTTATKENPL